MADTALGIAALSVLPKPPGPAAAALTVTQIAQATTALLTALRRFQNTRGQAFDDELRKEAHAEQPTLGDVVDSVISRELGFEATFRAKQYERLQAGLGPALAIQDTAKREAAVKALFERERRYTKMREEAMRVRVMAAIRHHHMEQASPQGAYWMLGANVKQHTLDCLAMANHFWPWSVLHTFQPPVHHGCACSLMPLQEAVSKGLMTEEQVPNEMAAVQHATDRLQRAANAMRNGDLREQDIPLYLTALRRLEEAEWDERFPKGTRNAGRFKPRFGGDPGMILKRLGIGPRGKVMADLMPDARPLAASERGKWTWVQGRYLRIPEAGEWSRQIGGERFHSPAGTTNVYRGGQLVSLPQTDPATRGKLVERVTARVSQARARYSTRRGAPLRAGDGPEAVLSMEDQGFVPHRMVPAGPGAWRISYQHESTGAHVNAVVTHEGQVTHADWDTAPIPPQSPRRSALTPRSFSEHTRDALAWAGELGDRHGASVRIRGVQSSNTLEDHAGYHEHSGEVWLGPDVATDIDRAGAARAEGRELTDDEKRGVWSSYWTTAHEIGHAVNPIHPSLFQGEDANLEEALTEENAHRLAQERLAAQGQHDVLRWRDANPRALAVKGVYRKARGGLANVLDAAGVSDPAERSSVIESLKFGVDPARRFEVLGQMIHAEHPEVTAADAEQQAREALLKGGKSRSAVPQSPGIDPFSKFKGKWHHKPKFEPPSKVTDTKKATPKPKPPPVVLGGKVPEPVEQGPIPSFEHIPLELRRKAWSFGDDALEARGDGADWIVKQHHGDKNRVAEELLSNAIYRALGVNVPVMGRVETPGAPDFAQIPDALTDEPPLPDTGRISTGVIIRAANGKVTVIEPRNHYGGYIHTFPKGGLEPGLTAQQNALKELWEETGLHAHITGVVGDFKGDTGVTRYYIGSLTGGAPTPSDETEAIKTVSMKDAAEMLNKQRDKEVLAAVAKAGVPKGKFKDDFPPVTPGVGVAFQPPKGKKIEPKAPNASLSAGYMVDALLGNWDFVGKYGDNLRWQGEDNPIRVNHGATFEHRPNGDAKQFGEVPEEAWSMLYRGQGAGAVSLSEDQMRAQAKAIAKTMTPARIDELVAAAPFRDQASRERIAAALKGRVEWMRQFGAGEIDMPQPAEGAEAEGLHADGQAKFTIYPEEQQAVTDYLGTPGRTLDEGVAADTEPSSDSKRIAKHLDNLLGDARTSADTYAYIGHDKQIGPSVVGQAIKQKSFTIANTNREQAKGQARIRVLVPGGSRAWFDGGDGEGRLLFPRGQRMKITGVRTEADGSQTADALLLPTDRPGPLYQKPWKQQSYSQGKFSTGPLSKGAQFQMGDKVLLNGLPGKVVSGGNKTVVVKMKDNGKEYTVPASALSVPKGPSSGGMASPGTTAELSPDGLEARENGHRWRIEKRPLVSGHPELAAMTDGTAIAHYQPGAVRTSNYRYIDSMDRAKSILRGWARGSLQEAALMEADTQPTGVMVALYPHPSTAKKFALPGGEDAKELHLTLAFLGKQDGLQDPEGLKSAVKDWAARTPPLQGEVSGHGVFTAGPKPVTYLSPDLPGLPAARQDLIDSLSDHPVSTDHGFTPHMTLDYADRSGDMPDHGGHKLRFSKATVKIGPDKHTFPLTGKSESPA